MQGIMKNIVGALPVGFDFPAVFYSNTCALFIETLSRPTVCYNILKINSIEIQLTC